MTFHFQNLSVGGLSPGFSAAQNTAALAALLSLNALSLDASNGYITAADGGITIMVPKGQYSFDASVPMVASSALWLKGDPGGRTSFAFTAAGCKLQWGTLLTASNHLVGAGIQDISIDGGSVAETLVEVRVGAKFSSNNLALTGTARGTVGTTAALALLGAQNGVHDNLLFDHTGGTALLLDYGAAGNQFRNMNASGCYEDGRLSGVHDYVGAGVGPNNNTWLGGITERDNLAHDKPWSWYIGAGRNNSWHAVQFVLAEDASAIAGVKIARLVPIIKLERQLGSDGVTYYGLSNLVWEDCGWSGSVDSYVTDLTGSGNYGANHYKWTTAFDVTGVVSEGLGQTRLFVYGRVTQNALREWVKDNTGAAGYVVFTMDYTNWSAVAGVDDTERMVGTGTSPDDLRHRIRGPIEARAHKADGTSVAFQARDNGNNTNWQVLDNGQRTGAKSTAKASAADGSSVAFETQNSAAAVKLQLFDDGAIQQGGTSGPKRLTGSGAPSSTPPDGSTYHRTDSATGQSNQYDRVNGAWVARNKPPRVQVPAGAFMNTSGATASQDTAGRTGQWQLPDAATSNIAAYLYLEPWAAGYSIDLIWMPKDGVVTSNSWDADVRLERIAIPAGPGTTSIYTASISTNGMTIGQWQITNVAAAYVPASAGHFDVRIIRSGVADSFGGNVGIIGLIASPN